MEQRLIKSERAQFIEKLKDWKYREAYIRASININLPSQIRALRLRQEMTQGELAKKSNMLQPRISAIEKPGAIKFNIETLIRLAAAFEVGLIVKFVPISEMVNWENKFSQDEFNVVTFARDGEMPSVESQAISGYYSSVPSTPAISFSIRLGQCVLVLSLISMSQRTQPALQQFKVFSFLAKRGDGGNNGRKARISHYTGAHT